MFALEPRFLKAKLLNGSEAWAMSSSKHAQEAVKNVKGWLEERDRTLPSRWIPLLVS
jgi:hypothetical protein